MLVEQSALMCILFKRTGCALIGACALITTNTVFVPYTEMIYTPPLQKMHGFMPQKKMHSSVRSSVCLSLIEQFPSNFV